MNASKAFRDPRRPVFFHCQSTPRGRELVISLYTKGCQYRQCTFCSLPALSAGDEDVSAADIRAQVDLCFDETSPAQKRDMRRLSLYNSGSILDQRTLPTGVLEHLFGRLPELPALEEVCLDTRAEFVEDWELDELISRLGGRRLTLAVGYETVDERIRNGLLKKGLAEPAFQELCALLAAKGATLKAYVMVKPDPSLSETEAVDEAARTLRHVAETGRRLKLSVEAHLNPTYVARGSALEREFKDKSYAPPRLWSVVGIISRLAGSGLPIQVGLHTEGLAVRGGRFRNCGRCDDRVRAALEAFSGTQDVGVFRGLSCPCRDAEQIPIMAGDQTSGG